jgi:hypothetical protein
MPAVSKAQQRFMGMVHAADKGETPASPEVAKVSADMKDTDAKDFASTKHDGLPDHVKEQLKSVVREVIREKNGMNEMSSNDVHFKHIMKLYDKGGSFTKKKIGAVVCKNPKATRKDVEEELFDADYRDIIEFEDELGFKESYAGKEPVVTEEFKHIIHVDTPTQVVSKPVAAQIMALAKKGVRASEIGLEMGFVGNAKLAADTFQKVKNKIYFELDKRNESVNEASLSWAWIDRYANAISNLTQIDTKDVKKFIEDNKLNIEKIFAIAHKTSQGKTDFIKAIKAAPNSSIQNAYVKTYANESVNEGYPGFTDKKVDAKIIADRMRKHKDTKGFADKIAKMGKVSQKDLDTILPDYVTGGTIEKLFKESVNEAKVGNPFGLAAKVLQSLGFTGGYVSWLEGISFEKQIKGGVLQINIVRAFFGEKYQFDAVFFPEITKSILFGLIKKKVIDRRNGKWVSKDEESEIIDLGTGMFELTADDYEKEIKTRVKNAIGKIHESIKLTSLVNEEHDCGCNENHDCGCGGVHEHTHIQEDLSADANGIAGLTASRANAVKDFLEKNNINSNKLYLFLKKGNLKDRMDFVTALVGKPGNPIQKKVISQFSK